MATKLDTLTVGLRGSYGRLGKDLSNARGMVSGFVSKVNGTLGKGIKLTGIGAAIGAAFAALKGTVGSITSGLNFEDALLGLEAITRANADEMARLKDQAAELGKSTRFSATQAADAMRFLGMAGFSTASIMESLPGTLDLAAAGQLDLAEAADIASNILTGMGLAASDMARVSDVLAAAASRSNTSVNQLGEAMKYVAPVAAAAGTSLEEATAAIGALSDAGIQADMAGTSLRGILSSLANAAKAAKLEALGVQTKDATGNMLPLVDILDQLRGRLDGLGSADKLARISEIFDARQAAGIAALVNDEQIAKIRRLTGELQNSQGEAKRMATTMESGVGGAMRRAQAAMQAVGNAVFETIRGPMMTALNGAANRFGSLASWIAKLRPVATAVFAGIGRFVATTVETISKTWAKLKPIVETVATAATVVWSWASGAIGSTMTKVVAVATATWNSVRDFIGQVVGAIVETYRTRWRELLTTAVAVGTGIFNAVAAVFNAVWSIVKGIGSAIASTWTWAMELVGVSTSDAGSQTRDTFGSIADAAKWLGDKVAEFANAFAWSLNNVGDIAEYVGLRVVGFFVRLGNVAEHYFGVVIEYAKWFGQNFVELLRDNFNLSVTIAKNGIANIARIVANLPGLIAGTTELSELWTPLTEGFERTAEDLPRIAERIPGALEQALGTEADRLGEQLGNSFSDYMREQENDAKQTADNIAGAFGDAFQDQDKPKLDIEVPETPEPTPIEQAVSVETPKIETPEVPPIDQVIRQSVEAPALSRFDGEEQLRQLQAQARVRIDDGQRRIDMPSMLGMVPDISGIVANVVTPTLTMPTVPAATAIAQGANEAIQKAQLGETETTNAILGRIERSQRQTRAVSFAA